MPINHLLPFALPRGRVGTSTGLLTVYFAPRLKEPGVLGDYGRWEDWPATLAALNVQVRVDGQPVTSTQVGVKASSAVWRAVFSPQTPVAPHRFVDFSKTPRQPMASSDFSERILELYLGMARLHPEGPPGGSELIALATAAGLNLEPEGADNSLAESAAYRAPMKNAVNVDDEVASPEFDFHASVSLLGHHPELLRHLGLAVDLEIADLPANPTAVRVRTNFAAGAGPASEVALVTQTTADFLALPNPDPDNNEQAGGFLRLVAEKAFLSIVDPHLAASRVSAAADSVVTEDSGVLPALATRALSLVRPDVTKTFLNRTERQAELEKELRANLNTGGPPVELFAEDVTIGQRFDVLDQGAWRSLFERRSDVGYTFPEVTGLDIVPAPDEGWNTTLLVTEQSDVRPPVNLDADDPIRPTALFRLDDAVYRWSGWSGAAPAPGNVLDGATGAPAELAANQPESGQAAQVAVDYGVVPGSLPQLRFGRTYAMRARCVDLAGNSQPLSAKEGAEAAAPPETFGRLEPVAAPVVVRRTPRPVPGVGDSTEVLVLRSDVDVPDKNVAEVDRLLFPGRVGPDLCELHGLPGGGADPASYSELVARDALDLTDQTVPDLVSGEVLAVATGKGAIEPGAPRQEVEYLSDPAIGGVRLGLPGGEVTVDLKDSWPERETVRLVVAAGDGKPEVRPDADTDVRVFVAKGEIIGLEPSFRIADDLLEHFALWQRLTSGEQAQLRKQIAGGGHWMFTPARPLTLVHAVRRPLLAPAVDELDVEDRPLGSSAVVLNGRLIASTTSTERVTMTATWTDLVDDPTLDAPEPRTTSVALGELPVPRSDKNEVTIESLRAELHDTKRHAASVDLEAYTSFAAYFTEEKPLTLAADRVLLDRRGVVAGSVEVTVTATGVKAEPGVDFTVNGPAGTLQRNPRGALKVGAAVTVRYIPLPISRVSTEGDAKAFPMLLRNTAVPPPPVVDEVIPSFAQGADGTRSGQVLRIYLARPWLVTGEGEQLAVILAADGSSGSVVGRDPITTGTGRDLTLTGEAFPRATSVVPDSGRTVVAHTVTFDAESGRWYADVELGAGFGYRPFLRLVVARFQPDSVRGATLSSLVTLEPVRLGGVRSTEVVRRGSLVDVVVTGTRDLDNQIDIRLEQADPSVPDPDLTWQPVANPVRLAVRGFGDEAVWSGTIDVGTAKGRLRVVLEEVEPGRRSEGRNFVDVESVVFVETVKLPPV